MKPFKNKNMPKAQYFFPDSVIEISCIPCTNGHTMPLNIYNIYNKIKISSYEQTFRQFVMSEEDKSCIKD